MRANIKAKWDDGVLAFEDSGVYVKKLSETMWGVYDQYNHMITSGNTFTSASKKAKLLNYGYLMKKDEEDDEYSY